MLNMFQFTCTAIECIANHFIYLQIFVLSWNFESVEPFDNPGADAQWLLWLLLAD
jgi:hypothetical protein